MNIKFGARHSPISREDLPEIHTVILYDASAERPFLIPSLGLVWSTRTPYTNVLILYDSMFPQGGLHGNLSPSFPGGAPMAKSFKSNRPRGSFSHPTSFSALLLVAWYRYPLLNSLLLKSSAGGSSIILSCVATIIQSRAPIETV